MKKIRWNRLILLFIFLIIIVAAINFGVRWFSDNRQSSQGNLPQGEKIDIPDAPLTPQNMTEKQKQDVINQAQRDAIEAAKTAGETDSEIEKFGNLAKKSAEKAMSRPSSVIAE